MNGMMRRCKVIVDVEDKTLYTRESLRYEEYFTK